MIRAKLCSEIADSYFFGVSQPQAQVTYSTRTPKRVNRDYGAFLASV